MASSIIHLAVTNELMKLYEFKKPDRLKFGVILPDAGDANTSHLKKAVWGLNKKTYDFERFRAEYGKKIKTDDLYLGYYLHLVQDICYRHFVYDKYKWNPLIPGNVEKLHKDYSIINHYVVSKYHLRNAITVPFRFENEAICRLCTYNTDWLMTAMAEYFQPTAEDDIFFFTKEMADEYIDEAVSVCIKELNALEGGTGLIESYDNAWDNKPYSLLETTLNTRDLGSYRIDGSENYTKCGKIIRSDAANHPSEKDIEYLKNSGITTIIDTRSSNEKERKPHGLSSVDGFDYFDIPIVEGSGVPESAEAIPESYYKIAHDENISKVFKAIAYAKGGVMFGCTAGKDRTGVISALILWLCGVRKSDIVYDYMRTKENNKERFELVHQRFPEVDMDLVIPNENNMISFMRMIEESYCSIGKYFSAIGVDDSEQKSIKKRLITKCGLI